MRERGSKGEREKERGGEKPVLHTPLPTPSTPPPPHKSYIKGTISKHGRRMGRPIALTPGKADAIIAHIRQGCYPSVAAQACGISRTTFQTYLIQGQEDQDKKRNSDFSVLLAGVKNAEAEYEAELVAAASRVSMEKKDPYAMMMIAGRRFPERWAEMDKRAKIDIGSANIQVNIVTYNGSGQPALPPVKPSIPIGQSDIQSDSLDVPIVDL